MGAGRNLQPRNLDGHATEAVSGTSLHLDDRAPLEGSRGRLCGDPRSQFGKVRVSRRGRRRSYPRPSPLAKPPSTKCWCRRVSLTETVTVLPRMASSAAFTRVWATGGSVVGDPTPSPSRRGRISAAARRRTCCGPRPRRRTPFWWRPWPPSSRPCTPGTSRPSGRPGLRLWRRRRWERTSAPAAAGREAKRRGCGHDRFSVHGRAEGYSKKKGLAETSANPQY